MGDGGGHEIAYLRHWLAFGHTDMHEHAGFLSPGDAMGCGILLAGCAGDHHFDVTAFEGFEIFFGDAFLQCHESFEPVLDHVVRHLLHFGGRSAWARRIDEGECGRESRLFHHAQSFLEVLFGFTRETDDDVGGDLRIRHGLTDFAQNVKELRGTIRTAHGAQDSVGSGLQREVQLVHDIGRFGHGCDYVVGKGGGMRRSESHALQSFDLTACA